jgi:hypothetical protein
VLHLVTQDGAECMLQAIDDTDAQGWLAALRGAAAASPAAGPTMSAVAEDAEKTAKPKTSLFGFGKRK